jgi:hypothetical protein
MAANIRPKNNQDAYDKVLKAIRNQKYVQSQNPLTETCVYRGPNSVRCAAGHLLPNSLYHKEMEGKSISSLIMDFRSIEEYFSNVSDSLLFELQTAHDSYLMSGKQQWELQMKKISGYYNLVYTEPSGELA